MADAPAATLFSHRRLWLAALALYVLSFNPYDGDFYGRAVAGLLDLPGLFFLAALLLRVGAFRRLCGRAGELALKARSLPPRAMVWGTALFFLALTMALSQLLFSGLPHISDSHAMYMHAKILASGKWCEGGVAMPTMFYFQNILNDGFSYCSIAFPGHVMLMALAQLIGLPWLVNPVVGALTVWAVFLLAREMDGTQTGLLAAAMVPLSPGIVFMSSEYMNSSTTMLFMTLGLFAFLRALRTADVRFAALAGACFGFALITRVQAVVPYVLPLALYAPYALYRRPALWRCLAAMAATGLIFVLFLLYYNTQLTGNPWQTAYHKHDTETGLVMYFLHFAHWEAWLNIGQDLERAFGQIMYLHNKISGWAVSSLALPALLFAMRARPARAGLLAACVLSQCLGLVFVHGIIGTVFEPRYIYESIALLIVLTACCLVRLPGLLGALLPLADGQWRGITAVAAAALTLSAVPSFTRLYLIYSDDYRDGNAGYYHSLMAQVEKPALVFIPSYLRYRWVFFTMPPREDSPVIVAWASNGPYKPLMDYYPERHVYMETGPERTPVQLTKIR